MSIEIDPPAWVSKRDGSLVPFDADRISRALFAATETLGQPDAFLSRELTDGVVHFLAVDSEGQTPTTGRISEVVEQVVRELGRPDLAHAFAERGRQRTPAHLSSLLAAARQQAAGTYTRDLESARDAGLLILSSAEPDRLAAGVLGPPTGELAADLRSLGQLVGRAVALDGLESRAAAGVSCHDLAGQLAQALVELRRTATINLNLAAPSWADPIAAGPLFAAELGLEPGEMARLADGLLDELLAARLPNLGIDWHLGGADFEPGMRDRLLGILTCVREGAPVSIVFDRPRRPLALGMGLDRRHPAVLVEVGLNLPALARQPGLLADAGRFRQRLGTLVRLALSAAAQKRDHVRQADRRRTTGGGQGPALTSGFLLDRARVVIVPVGLDEVVTQFTGWSMSIGGESLDFARSVVRRLREALDHDGRRAQMECSLDGPTQFAFEGNTPARESVAGLTPWDPGASLKSQVRAGTALHSISEAGTLALFVTPETSTDDLAGVVQELWRQTGVVRVRLV